MSNTNTYRKTALMLTALMVLMPMIQMIEAPTEIEEIIEENASSRAATGTLSYSFEQTDDGEASGWVQAEGLDNTAAYSLAWSVESDSDGATVTGGSQTLSTGVSNATVPINAASLVDYETYCLNATLTSGSDTIDTSSTCVTIYPEVDIGGPELSVEIWGWDDGTAEAIIDIDNLAGAETYTLDWELLEGNGENIAESGSEDLTGQLSTMRSTPFTGLADDYHCLEATLSLDGDEVADAWDCFTAVMAGVPEASAHIEDADFGKMEIKALVWNLTSGDEYKVEITAEDTTFGIVSESETYEFTASSPAWVQEVSFEQFISGEYQINFTLEDITNGGIVAEWNDTFTMESMPLGPPGSSFEIIDAGDGRISATLDLWNLSTGSTYELVWNQTSDWVDGTNGSISWEAAAHNISFAAFNAGPMPKGVYHWVVQAYVDNMHMGTFYPSVSVTSQSPWSPDIGMTTYDDGFGGADIGLYAWNLEVGGEYELDWELANEDGTPIEGDSIIIVATGPVHTEEVDVTAIGKGEYMLTTSLSDAENWYSSAGSIFEVTTDPPYVDSDGDGIPDITDQCGNSPTGSTVDGNGCSASQGVWASADTVIDRASIDKALGIDVADSGNYAIGGVTRESDGPSFEGFVDLGAYNDDTCAVHSNGSITCWGNENTLPFTYKDGEYVEVELARGVEVDSTSERAWTSAESHGVGKVSSMVSDSTGATYVAGTFSDTLSLGTHSLTSQNHDGFIAKLSATGTWDWAIKVSAAAVNLNSIDIDSSENYLVITGSHIDDITYDSSILTGGSYYKAFVAKLGVDGTWVWMTNAGSGSAHSHSNDVAVNSDGNIYVTGTFSGTFSYGTGSTSSSGWSDLFLASLDDNGNWLWAKNAGASDWYDHGMAVSVDDNGGVYVAGGASGGATFDSLTLTGHSKNADGFIAKADDSDGNWLWVEEYGSTANEYVNDLVTSNGKTFITGSFAGTVTLGTNTLSSAGSSDIIVASIDSNGDWDWATRAGATGYTPDSGGAIDIDDSGNLYVTGVLWYGASDFGNIQLVTSAASEIFVASLDSSGKWVWADTGGSSEDDRGSAIAYNIDGTIKVGGYIITDSIAKFGDNTVDFTYLSGQASTLVAEYGFATVPATGICAIDIDAELECWNLQQASWIVDPPSSGTFTQLDGGRHFCATASTGEATCWGPEGNGQVNNAPTWTNITKTVAGVFHSCAQTTDRYIDCWGSVGHNWVPSPTSSPYLDISAGNRLTCSIKLDKSIECLGKGLNGNGPISPPVGTFMSIQSSSHLDYESGACAIDTDGGLSCWGGPDNIFSTIILDNHIATQVKVGASHACIINDIGEVYCSDEEDQSDSADLIPGTYSTCSLSLDGTLKCWGYSSHGQLGISQSKAVMAPVSITFSNGKMPTSVALGIDHACAILDDNSLQCWGGNRYGQLGIGIVCDPWCTGSPVGYGMTAPQEVDLGVGRTAIQVVTGGYFSCALLDDNSVKCWGDNNYGQLGIDSRISHLTPQSVLFSSGAVPVSIIAGEYNTCAILDDGRLQCWGDSSSSMLPTADSGGNPINNDIPQTIDLGTGKIPKSVSMGDDHICAILNDDTLKCWGSNGGGQLGFGSVGQNYLPAGDSLPAVDLGVGRTALAISSSVSFHTCVLLDDYSVKCWGSNTDGQLGDGTFSTQPNLIPNMVNFASGKKPLKITAQRRHSCALFSDSTIECWGGNSVRQIGDGTTAQRLIPTPVSGISSSIGVVSQTSWNKAVTGEASGTTTSTYDDGFIQYYDDSDNLLWSKLIAGENNDTVNSVAVDGDGNVIACGFFKGDVDFGDGTAISSTMDGSQDGFIAKYDSSGALLWTRLTSSPQNAYMENYAHSYDTCNEVVTDDDGTIFAVGRYYSYGRGTSDVSSIGTMTTTLGYRWTGYVARIDASGTTEWINTDRGTYNIHDIALTPDGDVVIAGTFGYTCHCEVDFGGDKFTKTSLGTGGFVAKMDGSTGAFLWGDAVSGPSWVHGLSVASTSTGEIYTTGVGYILNFSDGDSVDPEGGSDVYVIKYTENGDMIWKRYFGSDANDGANDLVTDEEGGVLVVGAFGRWIHYGNGQSFGGPWGIGMDVYVARLGPNGDFSWFRNGGGTVSLWRFDGDVGTSMDFGPDGTLHVVGHHFYNASFGDHDIGTDQGRAGFHATMTFDTDGDGVHDSSDSCSGTIPAFVANTDGCAPYQLDSDGDGITDNFDQCPDTPAGTTVNGLGCEPPTTDETPTCSMYTTTTLGQVETIGVPMETKPEWESLNYQRSLLSEGVYDVGLHCVDPNGDEFSLELVGPVESVQGSGSDVWIYLTDELLKGYETAHRFDYTWTQGSSQENGYAHLILIDPAMATNTTKRVALWGGKVNQHWDVDDLEWKTDPDGTSGAGIGALATCKKWYPDTAAVELMQHRETITFWTAGNSVPYESTKPIWECVADDDPRVLSGALQSGEVVDASTGTILATIVLTVAACGIGAIAVTNRKAGKVVFDDEEEEAEKKDPFIE